METLFAFDKQNYRDCQNWFRGPRNNEYYSGDFSIDPGSVIDVRADRRMIGFSSIIHLRSRTRQYFRRTWDHIRKDGADVATLSFVKRGHVALSHQLGRTVASAGDFIITPSSAPFSTESYPGADTAFELLHLTVPMQQFRRFYQDDLRVAVIVPAAGRKFSLAERILVDLFEAQEEMSGDVAEKLVESALVLLADALRDCGLNVPQRQGLADQRLQDCLRFVETHLSDPKLSVTYVAEGCGISPRYLSLLLKRYGSPFSTLIWRKRLVLAEQWLSNSVNENATISEIAYRIGFKNPAHFSRMFKREFKINPRKYRADVISRLEKAPTVVVDGGRLQH